MFSESKRPGKPPNFLIIGAPRSGTTTLYQNLKKHPEIFMSSVKEPMFFIFEGGVILPDPLLVKECIRDWNAYQSLFGGSKDAKAIGEASTYYLYSEKASRTIPHYLPDVKLIAILRNPVSRAYSHFLFNRLRGIEPVSDFNEALAMEEERIRHGWFMFFHYQGIGLYSRQIERYLSIFPRERFLFLLFDELSRSPADSFHKIFQFLRVEEIIQDVSKTRYNISGIPRNRRWHDFLMGPNPVKRLLKKVLPDSVQSRILTNLTERNLATPPMRDDIRLRLIKRYRDDILKTQELIRIDLSAWMSE
jgi:hypothetical protein